MKIGDLYYVPQNVTLMQFEETSNKDATPIAYYKTDKPIKVVVVERYDNDIAEVFYNGQRWCVKGKNLYLLEEKCPL
tara:strand:+ start:3904 stop:4134 length:231 start_codon:yes stop_codon:yes gene_type:complete